MSIFGDIFGGGDDETTTKKTTTLSPQLEEFVGSSLTGADEITNLPYQPYEGGRIAGFGEDTQAGFAGVEGNQGVWQPGLDEASGIASGVGQHEVTAFPDIDIGAYMNPFIQQVMDRSLSEMNRQNMIDRNNLKGGIAAQGAYGGSRHGILEGEQQRGQSELKQNLIAELMSGAYKDAGTQYRADVNNQFVNSQLQLQAGNQLAGYGRDASQMGYQDAAAMMDIGGRQDMLDQAGLDTAYQDFLRQQNYPTEMLNLRTSVAAGNPYTTSSITEQEGLSGSSAAQNIGAFGALAGGVGTLWESGIFG